MATDISLIGNVVVITFPSGRKKRYYKPLASNPVVYFRGNNDLLLTMNGKELDPIPLTELRIAGAGTAPANTAAAESALDAVFLNAGGSALLTFRKLPNDMPLTQNTTALQDVTANDASGNALPFKITVEANKTYHIVCMLKVNNTSNGSAGGIGATVVAPTGSIIDGTYLLNTSSATATQVRRLGGTGTVATALPAGSFASNAQATVTIDIYIDTVAAGDIKIQVSNAVATALDTNSIIKGSYFKVEKHM